MSNENRVFATTSPPRETPITQGEVAPAFVLPAVNDNEEPFDYQLPEMASFGPVLLVFYQDDGMPICTRELNIFAQEHETLRAAGVQVAGMNTNGIGSHAKFHERDHFPFPLISDFFGDVTKAYGLWDGDERKSRRALVLIGEDGLVRYVQPHFSPGNVNAIVELFEALGLV
jgi:peroxiredoxin Q/BCP